MRAAVAVAIAIAATGAGAHPLGNFTTNRQARIAIAPDVLTVRYVVDLAELPSYRAIQAMDANANGQADDSERAAWAAGLAGDVERDLHVSIDGTAATLDAVGRDATILPGAGGLPTLRAEIELRAGLATSRGTIGVRDDGFAGLPGWQDIVVEGTGGIAIVESSAATTDPTAGLRTYPTDALAAPPERREARIVFAPGATTTPVATTIRTGATRFGDRLTALVADDTPLSPMVALAALLGAAALGALHALTPGHGKTIVGAYLVGTRGTWQHAVVLGLVVTATHTAGVYALGAATLTASAWVVPERLMPWLSALSGVLVIGVGASLVVERMSGAVHGHAHEHAHDHGHPHGEPHHHHPHGHHHAPDVGAPPTLRNLIALGVSGGLLPCPSALVVMLGAIALGRTLFGLALIMAFSVGLAAVLTAIGLVLVYARGLFARLPLDGRLSRFAPVASAAIVSLAGLAIVVEALIRIAA
jgi:ABC-type nickel/cobalt efflux system permease component RcnA